MQIWPTFIYLSQAISVYKSSVKIASQILHSNTPCLHINSLSLKPLNGKTMLCRLLFIANADQKWGLDWYVTLTAKSILSGPLNFGQNEDRFINVWSVHFLLRAVFFSTPSVIVKWWEKVIKKKWFWLRREFEKENLFSWIE